MERVLALLQTAYANRPETYAALKGFLTTDGGEGYATVAAQLGVSVSVVKVTVHRMRTQFRTLLRRGNRPDGFGAS